MSKIKTEILPIIAPPEGDESILPARDVVFSWQPTWLRAIAVAWADDKFKTLLLKDARSAFKLLGYTGESTVEGKTFSLWNLLNIQVIDSQNVPKTVDIPVIPNMPEYKLHPQPHTVTITTEQHEQNEQNVQYEQYQKLTLQNVPSYGPNGWFKTINAGGLKMYLVLQLPPKPTDLAITDLALVDYAAAGKVYPFTFS
ncbi:MAG: hypothetical protein HRT35_04775 [Algicola sp.]|nr:hypothetical protein [Algicola sp.]